MRKKNNMDPIGNPSLFFREDGTDAQDVSLDGFARKLNQRYLQQKYLHDANTHVLESSLRMAPRSRFFSPLRDSEHELSPTIDIWPSATGPLSPLNLRHQRLALYK